MGSTVKVVRKFKVRCTKEPEVGGVLSIFVKGNSYTAVEMLGAMGKYIRVYRNAGHYVICRSWVFRKYFVEELQI